MSYELFYTSAPKGLRPGARGYCTVAATQGLPAALMEKLESLSGYSALFPPLDTKASLNPVAYSHLRISVSGKPYSVLSRTCAAGVDYTERANKFAHHVALEPDERPSAGPAWLLEQPGFMATKWDGVVRQITTARPIPAGQISTNPCTAWEELTGDAGWAGVLAEAFLANSNRTAYLIFEPGMDLLPLISEACRLLPANRRWELGFTSYAAGLPQGIACAWRGVVAKSADAKAARNAGSSLVIDLTGRLEEAKGGRFVRQAREGGTATEPAASGAHCDQPEKADDLIGKLELSALKPVEEDDGQRHSRKRTFAPPPPSLQAHGRGVDSADLVEPPKPPRFVKKSDWRMSHGGRLLDICAGVGIGIVLAVGGGTVALHATGYRLAPSNKTANVGRDTFDTGVPPFDANHKPNSDSSSASVAEPMPHENPVHKEEARKARADRNEEAKEQLRSGADKGAENAKRPEHRGTKAESSAQAIGVQEKQTAPEVPRPSDLSVQEYLDLPNGGQTLRVFSVSGDKLKQICIHMPAGNQPGNVRIKPWNGNSLQFTYVAGEKGLAEETRTIAEFRKENEVIIFEWKKDADHQNDVSDLLRNSILELVTQQSVRFAAFSKPRTMTGPLPPKASVFGRAGVPLFGKMEERFLEHVYLDSVVIEPEIAGNTLRCARSNEDTKVLKTTLKNDPHEFRAIVELAIDGSLHVDCKRTGPSTARRIEPGEPPRPQLVTTPCPCRVTALILYTKVDNIRREILRLEGGSQAK
jgi:hypothetical protein